MIELRDYQRQAVSSVWDYLRSGKRHPLVVAPTGSGKSLIIAELCRTFCEDYPRLRIVVAVHSRELVRQDRDELLQIYPAADTGIYSAGLSSRELGNQITFAGIQSIYARANEVGHVDVLIVDEAHAIPRRSSTRYRTFIDGLTEINPRLAVIGMTATPYRLDSGLLTEGKGALFDGISYDIPVRLLIDRGHLSPVVSKAGHDEIDTSGVKTTAGEFNLRELEKAASADGLVRGAVSEIIRLGKNRKAWLVFASGVEHAESIRYEMASHGVLCEKVTGKTPKRERNALLDDFKEGRLKCLVNVGILTTGFNAPICDLLALMTATQSTGKYVQIIGRGMRIAPGKENCLVLDYGGNILRHGPVDAVTPTKTKESGNGEAPAKMCPECRSVLHCAVRICPDCGYEFPKPQLHHDKKASTASILNEPVWLDVLSVSAHTHKKQGKPDSLRLDFLTPVMPVSMWLALDHGGYASQKARENVRTFGGHAKTVQEALKESEKWAMPEQIRVVKSGRYYTITGYRQKPQEQDQPNIPLNPTWCAPPTQSPHAHHSVDIRQTAQAYQQRLPG